MVICFNRLALIGFFSLIWVFLSGLAVGPDLRIYVQDSYSGVHVFDLTGRYRRTIVEAVHQVHAEIFCNSIGILRFWQSRVNFLLYTISNPSIPLRERNLPVS